jgi:hypothetical protein
MSTVERHYKSPSTFKRAWARYKRLGRRVVAWIRYSDGTLGLIVETAVPP